jgi:hypothetical protein
MVRFLGLLIGVVLAVASGSLFAQSRTVPRTFDHVRRLGRALAEFKNDRIQIVTSYSYSQANHDSRWLLIEFGALSRTKTTIERDRIEVVTPDGRLVPHASPVRVRDADNLGELMLQTSPSRPRLYWYLPSMGSAVRRASGSARVSTPNSERLRGRPCRSILAGRCGPICYSSRRLGSGRGEHMLSWFATTARKPRCRSSCVESDCPPRMGADATNPA